MPFPIQSSRRELVDVGELITLQPDEAIRWDAAHDPHQRSTGECTNDLPKIDRTNYQNKKRDIDLHRTSLASRAHGASRGCSRPGQLVHNRRGGPILRAGAEPARFRGRSHLAETAAAMETRRGVPHQRGLPGQRLSPAPPADLEGPGLR